MNVLILTSAAPRYAPFSTDEKRPPLGLGYLMAALKAAGHDVCFVDHYLQPQRVVDADFLRRKRIDVVGLSMNTICYGPGMAMLQRLHGFRERGEWAGRIAVGGPHVSVRPESIPDYVDHVVQGEGEITFPRVVAGEVAERVVTGEPVCELDSLPFPAWEEFIRLPYDWTHTWIPERPIHTLNTSRGCPFDCTFCSVGSVWGRSYRAMSAGRVLEDVRRMVADYGTKAAYFREDHFTLSASRTEEFCRGLLDAGDELAWMCESRADSLRDPELVALMARAGCRALYIGVESGSPRMLEQMQKGETVDDFVVAFENARRFGIGTYASFVCGVPGETEEDRRLTDELIARIRPDFVGRNVFVAIPNSALYQKVKAEGLGAHEDESGLIFLHGHDQRVDRYRSGDPTRKIHPRGVRWWRLKQRLCALLARVLPPAVKRWIKRRLGTA
jgi:radical SAM superfamily enzyme YgiQ (UPF0313 family)